jgi:glyoxylase-like metal-dependent hydrolase (beta-lactamase superfamily II)
LIKTALHRISDRVYWLPPGPPDRPSLCAVVGERRTLMLDAGASAAHARLFLDGLAAEEVAPPSYVAATDWSDEALERRVAAGVVSPGHAANVKEELPSPREVRVAPADIVFRDGLDIDLGGVTVRVRHVGGDHAADSCVMYVEPDQVLFLGDCLYDSPDGRLTPELVFPLHDAVRSFGAELYVDGHGEAVIPRSELEALAVKVRHAESSVRGIAARGALPEEETALAMVREQTGEDPDDDMALFVRAFIAGRNA